MKTLFFIILTFILVPVFGQDHQIQTKISGYVIDSITKEPIPFANIIMISDLGTTSDFDGFFILELTEDSISELTVSAIGYRKKKFLPKKNTNPQTVKLTSVPLNPESEFVILGKPIDTFYFENGQIEKIKYQGRDEVTFYKSGQMKSQSVNGSYRSWFENGKLKYQSILKFNHHRTVTEWYDNNQIKEQGTMYWGDNKKTNEGDWFKNNDWRYWRRDGKEK
ncbi:MAG: carboxypeptidase-like regulatory domain-containing protein [Cytophagales bacterium]|nr:carboxypeptidase-like regulatory domain-containing protein [Cytophagales bacterium]